jgi:hypothetical protein
MRLHIRSQFRLFIIWCPGLDYISTIYSWWFELNCICKLQTMEKIKLIIPLLLQILGFILVLIVFGILFVSNSNCVSYKAYDFARILLGSFISALFLIGFNLKKIQKIMAVICWILFVVLVLYEN